MKGVFVTFDTAILLLEKGFNEQCIAMYPKKSNAESEPSLVLEALWYYEESEMNNERLGENRVAAPTYEQAINWLEEKHKIRVDILKRFTGKNTFYIHTWDGESGLWTTDGNTLSWMTRKEAMDMAIDQALKLIK